MASSPSGLAGQKAGGTPRASLAVPTPASMPGSGFPSGANTPRGSIGGGGGGSGGGAGGVGGSEARASVAPSNSAAVGGADGLQKDGKGLKEPPVSLFDADHIPTLYTRIKALSKCVLDASADANSLVVPTSSTEARIADTSMSLDGPSIAYAGPNIAMGATTDDDVNAGYEAALSMTNDAAWEERRNGKQTHLAQSIVRESLGLRSAFAKAQRAVEEYEGGEMDIEEQEHLLTMLTNYHAEQARIRDVFVNRSD